MYPLIFPLCASRIFAFASIDFWILQIPCFFKWCFFSSVRSLHTKWQYSQRMTVHVNYRKIWWKIPETAHTVKQRKITEMRPENGYKGTYIPNSTRIGVIARCNQRYLLGFDRRIVFVDSVWSDFYSYSHGGHETPTGIHDRTVSFTG